jgi:hypothetical protein
MTEILFRVLRARKSGFNPAAFVADVTVAPLTSAAVVSSYSVMSVDLLIC